MARQKLLECAFLIPLRRDRNRSDGRPHDRQAWHWLDEHLYEFGGATRAGESYSGWYLDPDTGERVTDASTKYFVAVPRPGVVKLRALLRSACRVFRQKCIYLSVAGVVEFVKGSWHDDDEDLP
jgi:hypothetical protein